MTTTFTDRLRGVVRAGLIALASAAIINVLALAGGSQPDPQGPGLQPVRASAQAPHVPVARLFVSPKANRYTIRSEERCQEPIIDESDAMVPDTFSELR